jgi:hypothetical protein
LVDTVVGVTPTTRRRRLTALAVGAGLTVGTTACLSPTSVVPVPAPGTSTTAPLPSVAPWPVMGPARMNAAQLAAWYRSKRITDATATVTVEELAKMYIEEGAAEGIAGDIAFVQAMLETGWLRFSTRVPGSFNNFAGIGAVDGGTTANAFPTARIGVRAQIQHLRAYADPWVTPQKLAYPLESPRFHLVTPKGKAPLWSDFGNGVWATDAGYAGKIDSLYRNLAAHAGVRVK